MRKTILVLGLGRYGSALALALAEGGAEVIAVDADPAAVDALKGRIEHCVVADLQHPEAVSSLCATGLDAAVVAVGSRLEAAIMAMLRLKEAGVPYVVCRAASDEAEKIFLKLGADKVVRPMTEAAVHLAGTLVSRNAADFVLLGANFAVIEYPVGPGSAGRSLHELAWRRRYHVVAIGLKRRRNGGPERDEVDSVDPEERLKEGDRVLLVGRTRDLDAFQADN